MVLPAVSSEVAGKTAQGSAEVHISELGATGGGGGVLAPGWRQ